MSSSKNEVRLRTSYSGEIKRQISEIPNQEIRIAILECIKNSFSISRNDLIKEVARLFSLRSTNKVYFHINQIIEELIQTGQIIIKFEKIQLSF